MYRQFTPSTTAFYAHHGPKGTLVGISRAPLQVDKPDYVLSVGRFTAEKGPH